MESDDQVHDREVTIGKNDTEFKAFVAKIDPKMRELLKTKKLGDFQDQLEIDYQFRNQYERIQSTPPGEHEAIKLKLRNQRNSNNTKLFKLVAKGKKKADEVKLLFQDSDNLINYNICILKSYIYIL